MIGAKNFKWVRKGLLVKGGGNLNNYTHASHACALHLSKNLFLLIFAMRDESCHSHIFTVIAKVNDGSITLVDNIKYALGLGKKGTFDSEGLLPCCPIKISETESYLYYSGWNNLTDNLWLCDTGLARIDNITLKFSKKFEGPVMGRDIFNPYFAAATSVINENGLWRSWYNSGLGWTENNDGTWKPRYGIHYAESLDGISWTYAKGVVIPFKDEFEHSFGRPSVIFSHNKYHMFFSCRGANQDPIYKMGYASSNDGIKWERNDSMSGISPTGINADFDELSVAYPFVFEHDNFHYLLYTGNQYGLTGFGYATTEIK